MGHVLLGKCSPRRTEKGERRRERTGEKKKETEKRGGGR